MEMQRTMVLIKPDALQRGLMGEIVHRFERKGLKLIGLKMMPFTDEILDEWYVHHKDKSFFTELKKYLKLTPIVCMVWEGLEIIPAVRKIVGITKGREAEMGSIRGDFAMSSGQNLIHASDSVEAAQKEIGLIFKEEEIFDYHPAAEKLVYTPDDLA
jgi:nucleoside-diphosphate kinase